jgi:hypothetical protein
MADSDRVWDLSIDGQCKDDEPHRIEDADWGELEEFGLDPDMVGLAVGTDHVDAKIALSRRLIEIHEAHQAAKGKGGQNTVPGLLPQTIMNRLVYGMFAHCTGEKAAPNILMLLLSLRLKVSKRPQKGIQDLAAHRKLLHLVAENPKIGKKKAAKVVGINPNAAKMWMDNPEFKEMVEIIQQRGIKGVN